MYPKPLAIHIQGTGLPSYSILVESRDIQHGCVSDLIPRQMTPKVLVANRGEIAIRILRAASELGWLTVAIYTENDTSHATYADEAVKLASVADYLDVKTIVDIAYSTQCTHVHPGYGFLSESPALPIALSEGAQSSGKPTMAFIGPSPSTLRIASDKMLSRDLAISLGVPVAPGRHVSSVESVKAFAHEIQVLGNAKSKVGYPLMIKALDGGGGRGIRVANHEGEVEEAFKRCLGESPSKQVFVEKALTGPGWKHIEVQVIGDGVSVNHFWERECSVQRRFQKIVEIAPSRLPRPAVQPIIDASLKMARHLQYKGLGTFEFLVNASSPTSNWVFLEINPRVQVEHTITEEINNVDLVRAQLLLFSLPSPSSALSSTLASLSLASPPAPPTSYAIQLRLNAEDPSRSFQLSPGILRARDISWPAGRGVRVDTWLSSRPCAFASDSSSSTQGQGGGEEEEEWHVGTEFDSLLAKIIVRGATFEETTSKGVRALCELGLAGPVHTNVAVLAGTLLHPHWTGSGTEIDTLWLERNLHDVIRLGEQAAVDQNGRKRVVVGLLPNTTLQSADGMAKGGSGGNGNAGVLLQPGSLFHLTLEVPKEAPSNSGSSGSSETSTSTSTVKHTITLTSIGQNAFPSGLSGTFLSTFPSPFAPSSSSSGAPRPIVFTLTQSTSANVSNDQFELADPNAPDHVSAPMTGKIVELHPALIQSQKEKQEEDGGDRKTKMKRIRVRKGEPLLILSVMKMENVVAAPCDGYVRRVGKGVRVGVVLGESMLVCVLDAGDGDEGVVGGVSARL